MQRAWKWESNDGLRSIEPSILTPAIKEDGTLEIISKDRNARMIEVSPEMFKLVEHAINLLESFDQVNNHIYRNCKSITEYVNKG